MAAQRNPSPTPASLYPSAGILLIGDELLSGKVEDENARFLVRELRALGVSVGRIEVIPDTLDDVAETVRALSRRFDYVFTSGGVGPTHDDVTLAAIAKAFEMRITRSQELERLLRNYYGERLHERDLRMADIPDGARLQYAVNGALKTWPVVVVNNVWVLPGVPEIFRRKFDSVRDLFRAPPIFTRAVYSSHEEGGIAGALDTVVAEFPAVSIGSYPHMDAADHKVKITLDGRDEDLVGRATQRIVECLGAAFVRSE